MWDLSPDLMTGAELEAVVRRFKQAIIDRALGGERTHHRGTRPATSSSLAIVVGSALLGIAESASLTRVTPGSSRDVCALA